MSVSSRRIAVADCMLTHKVLRAQLSQKCSALLLLPHSVVFRNGRCTSWMSTG